MNYPEDRKVAKTYRGRVHVREIRLNRGGYDRHGCYFGVHRRLFNIWDDDSLLDYNIREDCREDALASARSTYPLAMIAGLPKVTPLSDGACSAILFWDVETTDTFGGDPNYSWINRTLVCTPADTERYKARVLRQLRAAAGLTGRRATFADHGDYIEWRPAGACTVTFATPRW